MSEELKSCRFCGGEAKINEGIALSWVECIKCDAETYGYDSKNQAIKAWNTRADNTTLIEKLEGMKYTECCNELLPTSKSYNQAIQDAIDLMKEKE